MTRNTFNLFETMFTRTSNFSHKRKEFRIILVKINHNQEYLKN